MLISFLCWWFFVLFLIKPDLLFTLPSFKLMMSQAMAEEELIYHVALHKLELLPEEFKDIIHSKLSAMWPQHLGSIDEDKNVMKAIEELKSLILKTTLDGTLDQRYKKAIRYHQEHGTISGPKSSPKKEVSRDENYVQVMSKSYHDDQEMLFSRLIGYGAMDENLEVLEGQLKEKGSESTLEHVEMCNALDRATRYMLKKETSSNETSMTPGITEREPIQKMHDVCLEVVTSRMAVSATFEDDILRESAYKTWRKHVLLIASFGALAVALKRLL